MTIAPPTAPKPRAPAGLAHRGRRLWREVIEHFELSIAELEVLTLAARCLDRIQAIEDALKNEPVTVQGSQGQPRPHPLGAELRSEALLAAKLLAQLGLPTDEGGADEWSGLTTAARARKASRARWDNRGGKS
jgi:hypothetical protein